MNPDMTDKRDVLQVLEMQKAIYREIDQLADEAIAAQRDGKSCEPLMMQVDRKTDLIKANNRHLQELFANTSGERSPEKQKQVETSRRLIETMALQVLKKTQQLESDIRSTRDGMRPDLNKQVAASRMFRAYQKEG